MNWQESNQAEKILRIWTEPGQRPYIGIKYKEDERAFIEIQYSDGRKLNYVYSEDAPLVMIKAMCDSWVNKDKRADYIKRIRGIADYLEI